MSDHISVGVVGCRSISVPHLRNLRTIPGVTVRVVCDLDAGRAGAAAGHNGIPARCTDYRELLVS